MERYLEQTAYLHTGRGSKPKSTTDSLSIKTLCNLYLEYQESRVAIGEIEFRHFNDQISILRNFVKFIGPNRFVSDISTIELQNYRRKLIKMGKAAHTINNVIATIKATYNWAMDNEVIDNIPNLKAKMNLPAVSRRVSNFNKEYTCFYPVASHRELSS